MTPQKEDLFSYYRPNSIYKKSIFPAGMPQSIYRRRERMSRGNKRNRLHTRYSSAHTQGQNKAENVALQWID